MALVTADDVHMKQFATTKFREGYDQIEVDEFLDQVVETIATLNTENAYLKRQLDEVRVAAANGEAIVLPDSNSAEVEELRSQLAAVNNELAEANAQIEQLRTVPAAANTGDEVDPQVAQLQEALAAAQAAQAEAEAAAQAAQAEAEQLRNTPAAAPSESADAASMLALAQRVHDEYVKNGQDEANEIVSKAQADGEQIVKEANDERDRVIAELEEERTNLENKVSELKEFEATYCAQLREHLNDLLSQLSDGQ